jgi:hypothetical protein
MTRSMSVLTMRILTNWHYMPQTWGTPWNQRLSSDPQHPIRFKIIAKANPGVYGRISKVVEKIGDSWQDSFLYGFYRHGSFRNKYPITFNVQSHMMRSVIKRKTEKNPRQEAYYRTVYGILDLEPEENTLDFILSWLSSCKIQRC